MATVAVQETGPTSLPQNGDCHGDDLAPDVQMLAKAIGLDPSTSNPLMIPDMNFLEEMAKLPVNWAGQPDGTDVQGMRDWIEETLMKGPLREYRKRCDLNRRRPAAKVTARNVPVKCTDGQGTFNVRVWEPERALSKTQARSRSAILFFHGGGWIHGNSCGDEVLTEFFASDLDAVMFGVDYRLAPEHQYPLPLDDCSEALDWVIRNAAEYHVDVTRIGLLGGSAGGNLAAALALRYSQAPATTAHPVLRMVSLVVPATAHPKAESRFKKERQIPKSENELAFANEPPTPEAMIEKFETLLQMYLGEGGDVLDPLVSPLLAKPDGRHPRTHITVAACDVLRDQALAYGQVLRSAGVHATEEILRGVPHGFTFPTNAEVTKRWFESQRDLFWEAFDEPDHVI